MTRVAVTIGIMLAVLVAIGAPATATAEEPITLTQVLVNKLGGITITGTVDCAAVVAAVDWNGEEAGLGTEPENLSVAVNMNWSATQPVGRTKSVSASWGSSFLTPCYNTYPGWGAVGAAAYAWTTHSSLGSTTTAWVYPSAGKFAAGFMHVEVVTSDYAFLWVGGEPLIDGNGDHVTVEFARRVGFDVKAVRAR